MAVNIKYESNQNPEQWFLITQCFIDPDKLLEYFPNDIHFSENGKRDGIHSLFRTFVKKDTPLGKLFKDFESRQFRLHLSDITGVDCTVGDLRIELCQEGPGFYLERHVDIPEKILTMQIYLGEGNEENWGTSFYTSQGVLYTTVPFKHNTGWMTTMNNPLIHGVEQNKVDGIRKSVIINYVAGNWRDKEQLYDYASSSGDDVPQYQEEQETQTDTE